MAATVITVGGLTFNNGPDGSGVIWAADIPSGWDGTDTQTRVLDKVTAAGGVIVGARLGARSLVLNGTVLAPSRTLMWAARNTLEAAAVALLTTAGNLVVQEPGGNKTLSVRYVGRLKIDQRTANWFRFQLPLTAPNPTKT